MLRDNNSFLLLGHTGDTNDVSRPTLIYVDRFGNETDRIVLGELDFSTGQLSFTPASDGGVFIMALTNNGFRLTRLNPAGETLWSQLLPVGNTPNATEIAELPDGNLLALDSRFDLQTTAGFPVIVRLLDSNGDELSSFSNNSISLGYDRQLLVTPDSLIYLSGRDYLLRSGYLTAYRYGTEVPLWTTALTTPGFLMHGASDPSLHPDGAVGIILRGEAPTGTNNNSLLSYVKINDQGEEVGRTMLSDEWDSGVVRTSSQADSRTISFGITKNNGIDSGRHFIRVIDLDYETLATGRDLSISSPFGYANVAGIKNLDDGHTAILVTTSGTEDSYSSDMVLIVVGEDGAITDITTPNDPARGLTVFPNPAQEEITVEIPDLQPGDRNLYRLVSSSGQVVRTGIFSSKRSTLELSQFLAGTYFLQTQTSAGKLSIAKLLIR